MLDHEGNSKPTRRRAWNAAAACAALVLLLPGVLAGVDAGPAARLDDAVDPLALGERYRDYELQAMNPLVYRELLATGEVDLTLRGKTFRLLVERDASADVRRVGFVQPDGTVAHHDLAFPPVTYAGEVAGEPGSRATVVVTASGVMGRVETAEDHILFEPVRFSQAAAPPGVSVVFHAADAIAPAFEHAHPDPTVADAVPPPLDSGFGVSTYAPGPDRRITLWADLNMTNTPGWLDRVSGELATTNVEWARMVGFRFTVVNSAVYVCTLCNSTDFTRLLQQFAEQLNQPDQVWSSYEIGLLYTGTDTPGAGGAAWQPGRQAYVQGNMGDAAWRTKTIAHEVGHAFNAWHSRGDVYLHRHADGLVTHHSIMTGTAAWPREATWEFSTTNRNWIRACNLLSWTQGSRDAGAVWTFGNRCWNPVQTLSNGGTSLTFDATAYRGKLFSNVPPGDVGQVCAYANTPGSTLVVGVKRTAEAGNPLFTVDIPVTATGWNCAWGPRDYFWTHGTLFVYKVGGVPGVSYDTFAPYDGRASNDGGSTWFSESVRRGYRVDVYPSVLPRDPCGSLGPNGALGRDQRLWSCDGRFNLVHQNDGNVVLYEGSRVLWATNTPGQATTSLVMQADGNLVLYNGAAVVWASNTAANPGAWLSVRNDGTLMMYAKSGRTVWAAGCGLLTLDATILRGKEIRSCDNRFALAHQFDGNVVLYQNGVPLWATNTMGYATTELKMQSDGNLVLYNGGWPVWASHTADNPGSRLRVQDDGRIVIYTSYDANIWSRP